MPKLVLRIVLLLILLPVLLIGAGTTGWAAAAPLPQGAADPICPPHYHWTNWGGCRPDDTSVACASDEIGNLNGGARADNAGKCKKITLIGGTAPANVPPTCNQWGIRADGTVYCTGAGSGLYFGGTIEAQVGCTNILRQPFPRALVNVPVKFGIASLANGGHSYDLLVNPNTFGAGQAGYSTGSVQVAGVTKALGTSFRAPGIPNGSQRIWGGQPSSVQAFTPRDLSAHAGQNDYYPSIRVAYSWLELFPVLDRGTAPIAWSAGTQAIRNYHGASYSTGLNLVPPHFATSNGFLEFVYLLSSWGRGGQGPNQNLGLTLPAYRVRIAIPWQAYQVTYYQTYSIVNHHYGPTGQVFETAAMNNPSNVLASWRVRDPRVSQWLGSDCSQQSGYLGVPVLEAQSILVK
jgi:hypothetical protein